MTPIADMALDPQSASVALRWQDGREQRLPAAFLRSQCRCAECKARALQGSIPLAPSPSLAVTGIRPVGAYGVQLIFSDGHDRGIYPWVYLEELRAAALHNTKEKTNEQAA